MADDRFHSYIKDYGGSDAVKKITDTFQEDVSTFNFLVSVRVC